MVQMMYMLIRWDGEQWIILHYSHDFDDLYRIEEVMRKKYPDLKIMVDIKMAHLYDGMEQIKKFQEHLKSVKTKTS